MILGNVENLFAERLLTVEIVLILVAEFSGVIGRVLIGRNRQLVIDMQRTSFPQLSLTT
jgi:hypothetical protein